MSGKRRAAGPVRQLSLQQQQQQSPLARRPLRRQLSEEQGLCVTACSIRNSGGGGGGGGGSEDAAVAPSRPATSVVRPRPVKVAWAERRQPSVQQPPQEVEVVARRCPGQPRPSLPPPPRPSNLPAITADRDSILYTRQQLAERLRRAWKEREQGRPNLDIFLAHNSVGGAEEEPTPRPASALSAPSVIGSLSPTIPRARGSPLHSPVTGTRRQLSSVLDTKTAEQHLTFTTTAATATTTTTTMTSNITVTNTTANTAISSTSKTMTTTVNITDTAIITNMSSFTATTPGTTTTTTTTATTVSKNRLGNTTVSSTSSSNGSSSKGNGFVNSNNSKNVTLTSTAIQNSQESKTKSSTSSYTITNKSTSESINSPFHLKHQTQIKYYGQTSSNISVTVCNVQDNIINSTPMDHKTSSPREFSTNPSNPPRVIAPEQSLSTVNESNNLSPNDISRPDITITETDSTKQIDKAIIPSSEINNSHIADATPKIVVSVPPISDLVLPSDINMYTPATNKDGETPAKDNELQPESNKDSPSTPVHKVNCEVRPAQPQAESKDRSSPAPNIPAAVRRVNFRNSNYNKTMADRFQPQGPSHPPLTRALSAPTQRSALRDPPVTKSILTKSVINESILESDGEEDVLLNMRSERERNIRSAPARRRLKSAFGRRKARGRGEESSDEEGEEGQAQPKDKDREKDKEKDKAKCPGRRGLFRGAEVITMVSLMSPTGSDADEDPPDPFLQPPAESESSWFEAREEGWSGGASPGRPRDDRVNAPPAPSRIVCLRKSPKSVSFQQQPSISASFPSRRGSLAVPPERERRPLPVPADSRRRFVRNKSAPPRDVECVLSTETDTIQADLPPANTSLMTTSPPKDQAIKSELPAQTPTPMPVEVQQPPTAETEEDKDPEPQFQTPKERECWHLYRKMCEKGVSVSYDTVLRGMLTPTEYRLHRSAAPSTC